MSFLYLTFLPSPGFLEGREEEDIIFYSFVFMEYYQVKLGLYFRYAYIGAINIILGDRHQDIYLMSKSI